MPYDKKAFGVAISKLRVEKGLTQERFSGLAGIARSHLVALEREKKSLGWTPSGALLMHWKSVQTS